jgi:hypothetical protein
VIVGRIAWRKRSATSPSRPVPTIPEAGSHRRALANNRISRIPSQKLGNETPARATPVAARSIHVFARTAETTPRGIAARTASASAPVAS